MICKKIVNTGIALLLSGLAGIPVVAQQATASLDKLKAEIVKHPDSLSAHHQFIEAFRKSIPNASFSQWRFRCILTERTVCTVGKAISQIGNGAFCHWRGLCRRGKS